MADDWYEIMELPPEASPEDIKRQFRFLCQVWHPDKFSSGQHKARAEERMKMINAAYAALSDPGKRKTYDAGRASQQSWQQQQQRRQEEDWRQEERYRQRQEEEWWRKVNEVKPASNALNANPWWRWVFAAVSILLLIFAALWLMKETLHRSPPQPTIQARVNSIPATDANKIRLAAEQGNVQLQNTLGVMYATGQGVPQDYREAIKWYRRAAERDNAQAQNNLGVLYAKGQGVPRDYEEAMKWYRKAAEQGNAYAQLNIGLMYATGQGVPQDYEEAVKWYRKAAEQDNGDAQANLGNRYYTGQGAPQDYQEAMKWYRKAAEHGSANAQRNISTMYAQGKGVAQDYVEAYTWAIIADANGADVNAGKQLLQQRMTTTQIEAAQRRAKEIQAKLGQK